MTTSRIARKPVVIPPGVEVKIQEQSLHVKGPKGSLSLSLHPFVQILLEDSQVKIALNSDDKVHVGGFDAKLYRSIAGTMRANIYNMIMGVSAGFERKLLLVGVGYRAQVKGNILSLSLGFSHPTDLEIPQGVTIETPVQTEILVKGISKELVGKVAARIRKYRSPEPYKGKGIRYANEVIEIKETKKK